MPDDDAPVPRLPRGRMFKLSTPALVRIAMTLTLFVMIVAIQRPCAEGVSRFVTGFGSGSGSDAGSGAGAGSAPGAGSAADPAAGSAAAVDPAETYEPIHADMTPAELEAAMQRARAKALAPDAGIDAALPVDAP